MLPQNFNFDETHNNFQKIFFFGGSGIIGEILSSPFERAKVKLQTQSTFFTKSLFHYKELHLNVLNICKGEGWTRLFYGLKASLDRQMFFNIFRFYGYYYAMDYLFSNPTHEYRYIPAFVSCLLGTSIATLTTQASDVLKIKMQSEPIGHDNEKLTGSRAKVKQLVEAHGGRSTILFSGLKMNLLLQNSHAALELFTFFAWKRYIEQTELFHNRYVINTLSILLTNPFTTLIVAPLDYIHTQVVHKAIEKTPIDVLTCVKQTFKQEGIKGFYKGYLPLLYKTLVMNLTIATILQNCYNQAEAYMKYEEVIQGEMEYRHEEANERYRR